MMRSIVLLFLLSGCAHRWYYLPEIKGVGEIRGGNGDIVYRVPPKGDTAFSLTIRALGIKKRGDVAMLGMRMSFAQPKGHKLAASLEAREQVLVLGETPLRPHLVRTGKGKAAAVDLSADHTVVELLYELPRGSGGADGIEAYGFHWKVNYATKSEEQVARFDRNDAAPQQSGSLFPDDPFYPYDRSWIMMPGWEVNDPLWWTMAP